MASNSDGNQSGDDSTRSTVLSTKLDASRGNMTADWKRSAPARASMPEIKMQSSGPHLTG